MAGNKISQISSRKNSATGTISECYETRLCVIDRGYNESHPVSSWVMLYQLSCLYHDKPRIPLIWLSVTPNNIESKLLSLKAVFVMSL